LPKQEQLTFLLDEFCESGHFTLLDGVTPFTYTITTKGIDEIARLHNENGIHE
jgi:hypothetical protein